MAEDEFDPIPVLITKNPQGKKERMWKREELDITAHYKIVMYLISKRGKKHPHLTKETGDNGRPWG